MGLTRRNLLGLAISLVACVALASTVFGNESGVDPRLLLYAMAALACAVPARRLIAHLPLDRTRAPGLGGHDLDRDPAEAGAATLVTGVSGTWLGQVNSGTASARAATLRLVPALRDLARLRLADRHGISLDYAPQAAAAALGPAPWSVLRPDAPRPMDADRPGVPPALLAQIVDALEAL